MRVPDDAALDIAVRLHVSADFLALDGRTSIQDRPGSNSVGELASPYRTFATVRRMTRNQSTCVRRSWHALAIVAPMLACTGRDVRQSERLVATP